MTEKIMSETRFMSQRAAPHLPLLIKYTGKKYSKQSKDFWEIKKAQFYKKVKMSKDYDTAMSIRDKEV